MREFWNTTKKKKFIGQIYNGSVERWNFKQIESINSSWNYKWLSYFWPRPKNDSKYQKKFLRNFNKSAPLNIRRTSIQFRGSKRAINRGARKKVLQNPVFMLSRWHNAYTLSKCFPFFDAPKITQADRAKVPKVTRNPHKQILFFELGQKKIRNLCIFTSKNFRTKQLSANLFLDLLPQRLPFPPFVSKSKVLRPAAE